MKQFKCEEIMCEGCAARISKALTGANILHQVNLEAKTVTIQDDKEAAKAVEILDDLGYRAVEI